MEKSDIQPTLILFTPPHFSELHNLPHPCLFDHSFIRYQVYLKEQLLIADLAKISSAQKYFRSDHRQSCVIIVNWNSFSFTALVSLLLT